MPKPPALGARKSATEARIREVCRLINQADEADNPALLAFLHDSSSYVAKLAVDELCERGGYMMAERLVEEFAYFSEDGLARDPGCGIRTAMAQLFSRLGYGPARDSLHTGIRVTQIETIGGERYDTAAQLRAACALGLAELRDPHALLEITPLLFDRGSNRVLPLNANLNAELRSVAARAIGRLGNPDGLAVLSILLKFPELESNADVIAECMEASLALDPLVSLPLVGAFIEQAYPKLVASAAMAIVRADVPAGASLVEKAIAMVRGDALKAVCLTLAVSHSQTWRTLLDAMVDGGSDEQRIGCVEAFAVTGETASLVKLAGAGVSARVCAAAEKALRARV